MRQKFWISLLTFVPLCLNGALQQKLDHFFDSFGGAANMNSGEIYNGQKAGYATGGGVSVRNRVMDSKLATVTLPEFDAGCGGIDIYAGGFSFINSDQLISHLKSIGSSAIGYAFLLGLETVSPQVANTIKQLQSWGNAINSIGINSCEQASSIVGAVWPRDTMASQHICRSLGGQKGLFSDYISGRHQCSTQKGADKASLQEGLFDDLLYEEYNIAWEAIQKQSYLSSDKEVAEFFMTLMGTIIIKQSDGKKETAAYPSKIKDESFLRVLLEGGQASIYKCAESKQCLRILDSTLTIDPGKAWIGKARNVLLSMQNKILNDEELTDFEIDFLSRSRLPLYKFINVLTAYKKGHCPIDLYQIADVVAMDMLIQYLRESIELVVTGCTQLRKSQMYDHDIEEYLKELHRIEEVVRHYETRTMNQIETEFHLMQKIKLIEEQIASEIILR